MTTTTTTPLMGMVLPVPSVEVGPAWATEIIAAFNKIDSHTHSVGSGSSVTLSGINVTQNLDMLQYAIVNASYYKGLNNASPIAGTTTTCLYVSGGELYYNDASGNQVKLTSAGGINLSSIGAIGGDYSTSTASVAYSTAATTFTFTSATGIYSKINTGDLKIFERVASANYVELKTSTGLGASYTVTLPTAVPATSLPLIMSAAGALSTAQLITAQIADQQVTTVKITDANVTNIKLASNSVTTAKILDATITKVKNAALIYGRAATSTYSIAGSTATSSALSTVGLTVISNPVMVNIDIPYVIQQANPMGQGDAYLGILRDGVLLRQYTVAGVRSYVAGDYDIAEVGVSINYIDLVGAGGPYTYTFVMTQNQIAGFVTLTVAAGSMTVYEL